MQDRFRNLRRGSWSWSMSGACQKSAQKLHSRGRVPFAEVALKRETPLTLTIANRVRDMVGPMSAFGTKQTYSMRRRMSAFGGKADMTLTGRYVG